MSSRLSADVYRLGASDLGVALRLWRHGVRVSYFSSTPAMRIAARVPGLRVVLRRVLRPTDFERTISEYEAAFYLIQHETVRLTQAYYDSTRVDATRVSSLYAAHYATRKVGFIVKYLLQKEVKRFITWLYLHRCGDRPPAVVVVPDDRLHRFVLDRFDMCRHAPWEVHFGAPSHGGAVRALYHVGKCWALLLRSLWTHGVCRSADVGTRGPIAFRAHWPRRDGLLRTDFLIDGERIKAQDVIFYVDTTRTGWGARMRQFLSGEGYRCAVLRELRHPVASLRRLTWDYIWLPLRLWATGLREGRAEVNLTLLRISQLFLSSDIGLLLEHVRPRVLFCVQSASSEVMVAPVLCERAGCQVITYNFGITTYQTVWSDYAFHNAHVFLAWGPDVVAIYGATHGFDEVVPTGFWGYPEYRKALAERERLRAALDVAPGERLVVFYDYPYFPERNPFTPHLLLEFYRAVVACSKLDRVRVVVKAKSRQNETLSLYPQELREAFRSTWDAIRSRPNVSVRLTMDWDPLQMIAASDVNVTLELTTPSTIALLCGKPGFFLNTVEERVSHPLFPKYKGRLIFSDAATLVDAIRRYLGDGAGVMASVEQGDLQGYDYPDDGRGLERFRSEAALRAGLVAGGGAEAVAARHGGKVGAVSGAAEATKTYRTAPEAGQPR